MNGSEGRDPKELMGGQSNWFPNVAHEKVGRPVAMFSCCNLWVRPSPHKRGGLNGSTQHLLEVYL
jgi:hypothetical protein